MRSNWALIPLAGGSKRTADFAKKHAKPWLHLSERGSYESADERLAGFVRGHDIKVLNVAGSRGSKEPGVAAWVKRAPADACLSNQKEPVAITYELVEQWPHNK